MWETLGRVMALALMLGLVAPSAGATTPEEKQQFTVTGVEVDVTAADAAQARLRAIEEAQVKAFAELAKRLAGESGGAIMATLPSVDVGRMLASLSVESERSAPGRYIGKLTISFLPAKVREAFLAKGINLPAPAAADGILLIPVWADGGAEAVIWDDNPWRRALVELDLAGGSVPFRLPLGDTEDWTAFSTPAEATPVKPPSSNRPGDMEKESVSGKVCLSDFNFGATARKSSASSQVSTCAESATFVS
jgi:hypothetical protein